MPRGVRSLVLPAISSLLLAGLGSAQVFPGTGVGAIPDGGSGTPPNYGPPLVVSFAVSGVTQDVSHVNVSVTITHAFVGDVDMVLAAPGGSPALVLAGHIGVTTAGSAGDSSNYGGTYLFSDGASGPGAHIWIAAGGACDSACTVAPGQYRTTERGTAGQISLAPLTSLNAAFAGLTPGQANGTWTLTVRDGLLANTGSVAAATLSLTSAPLLISEFRLRGPAGLNDEYIEILNNSAGAHTVDAFSGSGYGVAASDGVTRCSIPNGTVIPPRGHYLCANSVAYSLASYPAGNGTTATADATYTTDIPDNAGLAIFDNNSGGGAYTLAHRLDAVGSTSETNALYKEGTGYQSLGIFSINYAFYRDACGKSGGIGTFGACPTGGFVKDSGSNAADFVFVDTNGTNAGAGQRLGSPGPENLSSPLFGGASLGEQALDPCSGLYGQINTTFDPTSDPPNNSTFGTLEFRRTFTNLTGAPITRLRFRIIDQTTFPAPGSIADLRARTSATSVVSVDRPPCGTGISSVTLQGTTLEQPPAQAIGGAFGGSLSADSVTLATPLANGASIDLRFLFGIQQSGSYKLGLAAETLPVGTHAVFQIGDCSDIPTCATAKGDFNGDGVTDLVFRRVSAGQQNKVWYMNGKTRFAEQPITPDAQSADWLIRGVDDFLGDRQTDLAFWNQTTGAVEFWAMNGVNLVGAPVALSGAAPLPTNWDLSATADFNADDRPDIVWRNFTSQKLVIWTMNGTAKIGNIIPSPDQAVNANWIVVAAADYTGDGHTDFLWYNTSSGKIVTWYMDANVVRTSGQFTSPDAAGDANWKVVASADYSASDMPGTPPSGSPDIVWRNATSGNQVIWHLNFDSTRVHGEFTEPVANTAALDWVIVGPR